MDLTYLHHQKILPAAGGGNIAVLTDDEARIHLVRYPDGDLAALELEAELTFTPIQMLQLAKSILSGDARAITMPGAERALAGMVIAQAVIDNQRK